MRDTELKFFRFRKLRFSFCPTFGYFSGYYAESSEIKRAFIRRDS